MKTGGAHRKNGKMELMRNSVPARWKAQRVEAVAVNQLLESVFALLPASAQDARQNLLRPSTLPSPVATPGFASHHHQTNRRLNEVVGGWNPRTVQEREQVGLLMLQVARQSLIGSMAQSRSQ